MAEFREREKAEHQEMESIYAGLENTRAKKALYFAGLKDKDEIIAALHDGRVKKLRNVGRKALNAIYDWLGEKDINIYCPHCGGRLREAREATRS